MQPQVPTTIHYLYPLKQKCAYYLAFVAVLMSCSFHGNATNYTSSGTGGNWSNAATWGGAGVPGSGDNATISHGTTVTVNGNYVCNNLTLGDATSSSAILTVASSNTLTINGICNLNPSNTGSSFSLNAAAGTINIAGSLVWSSSGTVSIGASVGTINITPAVTISSSSQSIRLTGAGNINFNSSFTDSYNRLIPFSGGTVRFSGNYTVNTTSAVWTTGTAAFAGTGSITANSNLTLYNFQTLPSASTTFASSSGFLVIGNAVTLGLASTLTVSKSFEVDGNWSNNGGTLNEGANTITFNGTGTSLNGPTTFTNIQVGTISSSMNVALTLNSSITCTGLTINGYNKTRTVMVASGSTLTVNGNVVIEQPTLNKTNNLNVGSGSCLINGNLTFTGITPTGGYISQVTITSGSLEITDAVNFDANPVAANQVITLTSTGVVTFKSAINMAYGTLMGSGGSGTVNFNGSAPSLTFGGVSGPVLSIPNGCTLNFSNGFTANAGAITSFGTGSMCNFTDGAITAYADVTFGQVMIAGTNSLTATGSAVRIASACTLAAGSSFTALQDIDITGMLTIGAGSSYMQNGGNVKLYNDVMDLGSITASVSGGIYLLGVNTNLSGTGSITNASGPVYIANNKSITAAASLTFGTNASSISFNLATNTAISNAGTAVFNGNIIGTDSSSVWINSGTLMITGALLDIGSLDASSTGVNTVEYNGSGYQVITTPINSYYDLTISNSGLKQLMGPVQVDDAVSLSGSVTLSEGVHSLNGGASLTMVDSTTLELQRDISGTYPELGGVYNLTGGTVILSQTTNPATVTAAGYHNLVLTGTNSFDVSNVAVIANNLTLADAAWLSNTGSLVIGNMLTDSSSGYSMLYGPLSASGVALYAGTLDDGGSSITITGSGAWTNSGGNFVASGIASFSSEGGVGQIIGGSTPTSFHSLQISNPDNVVLGLNPPATTLVTGSLDLTRGNLVTDALNILELSSTASSINGSAVSYVSGPMVKTGNESFVFPLGAGGRFGQVGISGMPSASSQVTGQYFDGGYSSLAKDTNLTHVSAAEYWEVQSADPVELQLHWADASSSDIGQCSSLTIVGYDGAMWRKILSTVSGGSVCTGSGDGSIASNGDVGSSSIFTFGSGKNNGGMLPVKLLSFDATVVGKTVLTAWETATEIENAYFTVERSTDGRKYSAIGSVAGAGNSNSLKAYRFYDGQPLPGITYYRLIQTDIDGHSTQSSVTSVNITGESPATPTSFIVYPNPAKDKISIRITDPLPGVIVINIYNSWGSLVYNTSYDSDNATLSIATIPLEEKLSSGIYTVSVSVGFDTTTQKLVVQ